MGRFLRRENGLNQVVERNAMDTVKISIDHITPYDRNAKKHTHEQIEQIKESIRKFGLTRPLGVWGYQNILVYGHGTFLALKELGVSEVPCVRLDHLSDEERRAYTLVDNQTTLSTSWENQLLKEELAGIFDIDMSVFDFDMPDVLDDSIKQNEQSEDDGYYGDERERTANAYNMLEFDESACRGYYQMPFLEPCGCIPNDIISFNYMLSAKNKDVGIHFYIDDYQFERVWISPQIYIEKMRDFQCVFTPDFSLYTEMPIAMKIWNIYRSRLIGQMCQRAGLNVIPTVSWCEEKTFDFCFDGLPENSVLSISTIGVKQNKEAFSLWKAGVDEIIRHLHPQVLLIYGGKVDYDYGDVRTVYYKNHVTDRMSGDA
nr:DUF4417 domain-containing protein [uncultured Marvinbryantia sp.]